MYYQLPNYVTPHLYHSFLSLLIVINKCWLRVLFVLYVIIINFYLGSLLLAFFYPNTQLIIFFPEAQVFWYHFCSKTFNSSPLMKTLNTNFSRDVVISSWLTFHFSYSPPLEITTRQITFLPSLNTLSTRFYLHLCLLNLICPSAQRYLLYKAFPDFRLQPKIWSLVILGHYWPLFLLLLWNLFLP